MTTTESKRSSARLSLQDQMRAVAQENLETYKPEKLVFVTFAGGRNPRDIFAESFSDATDRQHWNCSSCRQFVKNYGDLAMIDSKTNELVPLFWSSHLPCTPSCVPKAFEKAFQTAKIAGVFLPTQKKFGDRTTYDHYSHFHFEYPPEIWNTLKTSPHVTENGSSIYATLRKMLGDVVSEDKVAETADQALALLQDPPKLTNAKQHIAALRFLIDVLRELGKLDDEEMETKEKDAILWKHTIRAWPGCINSLRSGALSTLLENLREGLEFKEIERKWNALNAPDQYMRPQAAPSEGNVVAAEKLMEKMGITADDLKRRPMERADLPPSAFLWTKPSNDDDSKSGGESKAKAKLSIFAEVKTKSKTSSSSDFKTGEPTKITFAKFYKSIVPDAIKMEYLAEGQKKSLVTLITGLEGTYPLMQWHRRADTDGESKKTSENLASWYTYTNGKPWADWGVLALSSGAWVTVRDIVSFPYMWDTALKTSKDQGDRYLLVLDGVQDSSKEGPGLCLFPTLLRGELHPIRATIEQFSNQGKMGILPAGGLPVCGVGVAEGTKGNLTDGGITLRVTNKSGHVLQYIIDRMD